MSESGTPEGQAPAPKVASKKGVVRRAASFAALPITAPLGQIAQSTKNTRARMAQLKELRAKRLERVKELEKVSGEERFSLVYKEKGWTEIELAEQLQAVRKAKWAALISCFFWLLIFGYLMSISGGLVALFLAVVMFGVLTFSLLNMFRYGLYEAQIHLRSFISAKDFLARSDMWQRMFT